MLVSTGLSDPASAAVAAPAASARPRQIMVAGRPGPRERADHDREEARPASAVKITVHGKPASPKLVQAAKADASTPAPPFNECPAVGDDTSCGILIQVTDSANNILADPSQGPFDGEDDTLIGLLNSSSDTITSVQLSSNTDLFGFDGDGMCTQSPAPSGCPFGPTGYEGPGVSYSGITSDQDGGVVNFSPGIAPGQSAYFSLEEPLTATTVTAGGPTTGEQGGPVNLSENPTTCSTEAPVNCATGTFWHQFTDFSIPGRGVPLDLSRTYSSSQAATNGPLGYGWTDSYDMSLTADSAGDAIITQEDGSTVTFQPNGAGGFAAPPRVLATLTQNSDGSYTFIRDRSQVQYNFSSTGLLTSEVDLNGYATQLAYNASSQLTTVTDPAGRQLTFTYSGSHIASVTDPMGRSWSYSYDASGNLASATGPMGRTWSFTYDPNHLLLTMTDPRGGVTTNAYNASDQVTSQSDPDGNTTTWSYTGDPVTSSGGTTTMTDPDGIVTTYSYSNLELQSVTHASGSADAAMTSYSYDPATLGITSVTDPQGNVTTSSYDSSGNLLSTTDPLGNMTSYTYNSLNQVTSETTPLGETTSYAYDSDGNLQSITDPLGGTTTYAYADSAQPGDVTSVTDPDGDVTTYTYDAYGDVASASVSPSAGVTDTTTYAYDADGEKTCVASPDATNAGIACPAAGHAPVAGTTATAYDAAGEVTSVTNPDGDVTSYAYDGDGNQAQVTDPDGNVTSYAYNGDNQQTKVTRPDGTTLTSAYDGDGNLTSQGNAAGDTTKYTYDGLGLVSSVTTPLGQATSYGYDLDGNRTTLTDPSGRVTSYSYNAGSELTGITYSDGKTPAVSYSYDADGQRLGMTDGTGSTSYSYDADGHLTSVTNGADATVSYAYDPDGLLTTLTYPSGNTVSRSYDGAGRLTSVTDWLGNKTTFGYDADGNLTAEKYPNGVQASSAYDQADQLTGITDTDGSATLARYAYARDHAGQVTSDTETGDGSLSGTYTYNKLSQLASDGATPYSYDAAGDPTSLATAASQAFNAGSELTSSQRSTTASAPVTDQVTSANETTHAGSIVSPAITTTDTNELVLAFVTAAGPAKGTQKITSVSGGGLTWTLVTRADAKPGTAEVWRAHAVSPLTSAKVTAALADTGYDGSITVATFTGAQAVTGAQANASADSAAPAASVTTTGANSVVWGSGEDSTSAVKHTAASGQTLVNQYLDTSAHATYWAQKTGTIAAKGTKVTLGDTTPGKDNWNLTAVEITSAAGAKTSYGYDSDGNRTSVTPAAGPATALGYDQANRLISYGGIATYAYDGDGLRMSKTVSGTTTAFSWDQSGSLPLVLTAGTTSYIYGPSGQPIEQITGSTPTYLQGDQQHSTRLLTSSTGAVVGTYSYTPYGIAVRHAGTVSTALEYDGQFTDTESGYQYLQARYYDPSTAQFLNIDPMVNITMAPYAYTADNPLNQIDPAGLSWLDAIATGVGLVGLGLGIAAVLVTAPATAAVLTGAAIIVGGISAGIGLAESANTCFNDGWGSNACGGAIAHANLNTLFTAASARFLPDLKGLDGVVETELDYLAGTAIDRFGGEVFNSQNLACS